MDSLEQLKLEAVRAETQKRGRKLTGLETLEIEKKVEEEYRAQRGKEPESKTQSSKLPLSMYRFD